MKLTIKKTIGETVYPFTFEGKNLHECVMESKKLSFPNVHECGLCKSKKLVLNARLAQNKYKYTEIKCLNCKAQLVFGTTQEDPDVFYLRKNDDKTLKWEKHSTGETQTNTANNPVSGGQEDSDLPF